jgi:hypothetical protein
MFGTGVGTFTDRLRDTVRGGGPFSGIQEQGFINGLYTTRTRPIKAQVRISASACFSHGCDENRNGGKSGEL